MTSGGTSKRTGLLGQVLLLRLGAGRPAGDLVPMPVRLSGRPIERPGGGLDDPRWDVSGTGCRPGGRLRRVGRALLLDAPCGVLSAHGGVGTRRLAAENTECIAAASASTACAPPAMRRRTVTSPRSSTVISGTRLAARATCSRAPRSAPAPAPAGAVTVRTNCSGWTCQPGSVPRAGFTACWSSRGPGRSSGGCCAVTSTPGPGPSRVALRGVVGAGAAHRCSVTLCGSVSRPVRPCACSWSL
jgi:hypothetical protein